jgi:sortase B
MPVRGGMDEHSMENEKQTTGAGVKAVRAANEVVNLVLITLILLLFAAGCYAVWDAKQIHQEADAARYAVYKPTAEYGFESFGELQKLNPETAAWLSVYGTHIDYPVMQSTDDNMKYVSTDAEGGFSLSGSIFLDYKNSKDFSDFNSILYGHHMYEGMMFGDIELFADKEYFDARRYGNLFYGGRDHGIEFFAFLHADAYDTKVFNAAVQGEEQQQAYLDMLLGMSKHTRGLSVTTSDRIILLSTCSTTPTNGRDILVGRITDEVFEDIFMEEEAPPLSVDSVKDWWEQMPLPFKVILSLLPLALIPIIMLIPRKKKRDEDDEEEYY